MKERMFVVAEVKDCHSRLPEITESELKRRLITIWARNCGITAAVDILLYGEGEAGPVPVKNDTDATSQTLGHVKEKPPAGLFHGPGMLKRITDDKPSPTRAQWKLWIQDLPRPARWEWPENSEFASWLDYVEQWLENAPCVPKK